MLKKLRSRTRTSSKSQAGFTLLELLVVIAILALLIGLAAPAALEQLGGAKNKVVRQAIERMGGILDIYKLDVGTYPTTDQGLAALLAQPADVANWSGPYLKGGDLPSDPWGHPFVYRFPSARSEKTYDLCSLGESGIAGKSEICNVVHQK